MIDIVYKKLDELVPYENNPRNITEEAINAVAESIQEFGFKNPILIDKNNVIVAGHTRRLASLKLGLDMVPCVLCDDLTPQQIKAFRLADNKTGEQAGRDFTLLNFELEDLADMDMSRFGFEDIIEDDDETEEKEVLLNDSWQIIIDCSSEEELEEKYNKLQEMGIECRTSTL